MIIDISNLLNKQEKGIKVYRQVPNFIPELNSHGPIEIKGIIGIDNTSFEIDFTVKLQFQMMCSRCTEDFVYLLDFHINENLDRSENQGILQNDRLDLTEWIRENILLHIPMKALCEESCKGLCPVCGINQNIQRCNCNKDLLDPRLSVLNDLLNGDE